MAACSGDHPLIFGSKCVSQCDQNYDVVNQQCVVINKANNLIWIILVSAFGAFLLTIASVFGFIYLRNHRKRKAKKKVRELD